MRWEFSEEQEAFRAALRGWLQDRAGTETVRGWLDEGDATTFEQLLRSEGWFSVGCPEELGGQGGGLVELAIIAEELGRAAAPASAWLGSMVALPALASAPDAAKDLLTDGVTTVLAATADTVPDTSRRHGVFLHSGTIRGSAPSVLGADRATRLVVPARTGSDTVLVLVDARSDGVGIHPRALVDRSRTVADVAFDGAAVTPLDGDAQALLRAAALRAAVLVAADSLGAAERMLEMAVHYSTQRKQFGVPIGSFQAVKHAAATMLVAVEAARSIVYLAAASVDQGHAESHLHAATAKAQATAEVQRVADSALTLHGAVGYTWEHDLQLFYKRAKLNHRLFGSPAAWNERIADALRLVPSAT